MITTEMPVMSHLRVSKAGKCAKRQTDNSKRRPAPRARRPAIPLPATLEVHLQTADMAEVASWVRGAERTGVRTVTIGGDDPMAMFRSFVAVTYITRQSEGR